jgi:asparagine synthase (glutamine-hydrolysing)
MAGRPVSMIVTISIVPHRSVHNSRGQQQRDITVAADLCCRWHIFRAERERKIAMASMLIDAYMGFSGCIAFPAHTVQVSRHHLGYAVPSGAAAQENTLIQWLHPHQELHILPQSAEQEYILLAGLLLTATDEEHLVRQIVTCLQQRRYQDLPEGEYCGCLVTQEQVWLWKTRTCNETIFYTHTPSRLRWSTNPGDLAENEPFTAQSLLQCCAGEDIFLYQGIQWIQAGTLASFHPSGKKEIWQLPLFSPPIKLTSRISLPDLAERCRNALLDATRSLAQAHRRIGILLSGGIDSAAVAAALAHQGAEVVAYHFYTAHPAADESTYAQAICETLSLPFVTIHVDTDAHYLSDDWRFPHPYGHAAYRWMEQAAEQARRDGISLLVTGRGGDLAFGPRHSYGLADIISAPITAKEKLAMMRGVLSTDWLLPDVLRSITPSASLISESSLSSIPSAPAIPFFREQPIKQAIDIFDPTRFSPQDVVLEKTLWQPNGIRVVHPYFSWAIQRLSQHIPTAYRLLPVQGMKVTKPVLRLAWAGILPSSVLRYRRSKWVSVPHQEYCIHHVGYLAQLIGSSSSQVVQRGLVNPRSVQEVLSRVKEIRAWYDVLIATAMTELFLRSRATGVSRGKQ